MSGLPPAKGTTTSPLSPGHPHADRGRSLLEAVAGGLPNGFETLRCAVALELTLYSPVRCPPGDALNFLGGVGDVLQRKRNDLVGHLGPLADVAVYHDDRQIRRVRFDQRIASEFRYRVRVLTIGREPIRLSPLPRRRTANGEVDRPLATTAELCVVFANLTMLSDYHAFLDWCVSRLAIASGKAEQLLSDSRHRQVETEAVLSQLRELRDAIRRVLSCSDLDAGALDAIIRARRRCGAHELVELVDGRLIGRCDPTPGDLELPLCAITRSLDELLGANLRARIRCCADERCGRLFIDWSRNRTRRWCDMSACGNRAKVRRFRQRQRRVAKAKTR